MMSHESGLPYITISLVLLCLAVKAFPAMQDLFIYDREAILSGEYWRLLTGHFAHFSWDHLFWNIIILCVAGWTIEARKYPGYFQLCVLSALAIGVCLFLSRLDMVQYAGLSGIVTTLVIYVSLSEIRRYRDSRGLWIIILLLVTVKILIEVKTRNPLFVNIDDSSFAVSSDAHIIGAMVGSLYCFLLNRKARKSSACSKLNNTAYKEASNV